MRERESERERERGGVGKMYVCIQGHRRCRGGSCSSWGSTKGQGQAKAWGSSKVWGSSRCWFRWCCPKGKSESQVEGHCHSLVFLECLTTTSLTILFLECCLHFESSLEGFIFILRVHLRVSFTLRLHLGGHSLWEFTWGFHSLWEFTWGFDSLRFTWEFTWEFLHLRVIVFSSKFLCFVLFLRVFLCCHLRWTDGTGWPLGTTSRGRRAPRGEAKAMARTRGRASASGGPGRSMRSRVGLHHRVLGEGLHLWAAIGGQDISVYGKGKYTI